MSPRLSAALAVLATLACGCDWDEASLLNGVSVSRPAEPGRTVRVYLGLDGISYDAMTTARERGAFAGFNLAKAIPMFPATSDASWTRILHAPKFGGYEFTYYDWGNDRIEHEGLGGLIDHVAPQPHEGKSFPYYDAFDLHGSDYFDGLEKYAAPGMTYGPALDQLFVVLAGRLQTQDAFVGYVVELDIAGHCGSKEDVIRMLVQLSDRIEQFRANHPEVTLQFTFFSDHGLDHTAKDRDHFVSPDEMLRSVGIEPVHNLRQGRASGKPTWAVASQHTRVTYATLSTDPPQVAEAARLVSTHAAVDLVVASASAPDDGPPAARQWTALYVGGTELLRFGYEPATDTYWLPPCAPLERLDVHLPQAQQQQGWASYTDEALFAATLDHRYPDLFYRARTSLLPISVKNAAPILYSLKNEYAMKGFSLPGSDGAGASGSHGSMERAGSETMVMSEERPLPPAVRSENVLELFPLLKARLAERGVPFEEGDPGGSLDFGAL